jgi:PH (Pleckstrin Homology) domain-containing protein
MAMSRSRTDAVILRRRFDFWFGWLVSVGIVVAIAYATLNTEPPYDARVAVGQVVFGVMAWSCWLLGPHPRIVATPEALVVVNWFTRTDTPWSAVRSIEVESGRLVIVLDNGMRIRPATGGESLAASMNRHRLQNDLSDTLERWRSASAPTTAPVRRRLDLPLWFPAATAAVLIICSCV